jgi:hypothetical protein
MPTSMFPWTNVQKPYRIYLVRGVVSPTRTAVSINHACFAVFAGAIQVEIPLICAIAVWSPKLLFITLT